MIRKTHVIIDCPDTTSLARFYADLLGGEIGDTDSEWITVTTPTVRLGFQRVEDYRAPEWPGQQIPQQLHLDFEVDDFQAEGDRAVGLGARHLEDHLGDDGTGFVVYLDPAGHPFCLVSG
ncbi:hypothetical protein LX16_4257 [Stackebrandtia albiflava]|uniref:VOC domain-containing protein n=1 Tax=Stackebrandtia albiflava TaxID=406432 RepID=A0A562UZ28_9ACTN|nr:VOC family protein [Stackebrandtia albiflava]TWJ10833.1 hypothetical protein LX16_4257 [Stackebrandtia albiflava]